MALCGHFPTLRNPSPSDALDKEECAYCFESLESYAQLFVCLDCFVTCCHEHFIKHQISRGHNVALTIRRVAKPEEKTAEIIPAPKIEKLSIAPSPRPEDLYETNTGVTCISCKYSVPIPSPKMINNDDSPEFKQLLLLQNVAEIVVTSKSAIIKDEIKAWELSLTTCADIISLDSLGKLPESAALLQSPAGCFPKGAKCVLCNAEENLWLCLVCSYVGCGRAQLGSCSGKGHALTHYNSTGHAVAVKLGTISYKENTELQSADIFCYACGDERIDKNLREHLSRLGINIASQARTERSLVELQIEQNLKFDFSMTTPDGSELQTVSGPWLTGLRNLGNTCYMAAILQALVHTVPSFRNINDKTNSELISFDEDAPAFKCCNTPLKCFDCTWRKLIKGLSMPHQTFITPSQWKRMIAGNHYEFSTMRQQDASEFLSFLLKEFKIRSSKSNSPECFLKGPKALEFISSQSLECTNCGNISLKETPSTSYSLAIPPKNFLQTVQSSSTEKVNIVRFQECLEASRNDIVEYSCSKCNSSNVSAIKKSGISQFPEVLVLVAQRVLMENGELIKSSVDIMFEEGYIVDLDILKMERINKEKMNNPEVNQVIAFGFSKEKAMKALEKCGNNVEAAINWIFDNPESSGPSKETKEYESMAAQLSSMGFTMDQARISLKETGGNLDNAIDWLFSHPMINEKDKTENNIKLNEDSHLTKFELVSFINHKGPSMQCGHYICHIKLDDGTWVLFNDDKVVKQTDPENFINSAYMYFMRRIKDKN